MSQGENQLFEMSCEDVSHDQARTGLKVHVSAFIDGGHLHATVNDNGVGGGSGLIGLKDRVESVSGKLTVSSPLGHGTTLTVRIPID